MKRIVILLISYIFILFSAKAQSINFILDTTFSSNSDYNVNSINVVVKQSGKYVLGGSFLSIAGTPCRNICRLLNDSMVDPSFNSGNGFNYGVTKIVVLPSNKMYVMGSFTSYSNINMNYLIRLNADGTPDLTFIPNFDNGSELKDFVVQSDGMLVVIGNFNTYSGYARKNIVRLKANGNLDLTFNCGNSNNGVFNKVSLQSTGKIILIGEFASHLSTNVSSIVRLLNTGEVDNTFSCSLAPYNNTVILTNIFMHSDDQISISRNDAYPQSFSKYNSNGGLISSYSFLVNATSILLESGNFLTSPTIGNSGILLNEYAPNGSLVKTYSSSGWIAPYNFSYTPPLLFSVENEIYMGCNYYETYTNLARKLVRILNTNEIDLHFLPLAGPNFSITDLAKVSINKYILIGGFTRIGSVKVNTIAMIDSSCIVNPSFKSGYGFNGPALCVLVQQDGKIIVGGDFTEYNNQPAPKIIRLNQDGSIDPSFNAGSGFDFPVYDVEIINADKILIAGVFGTYQNVEVGNIICLNTDGSINTSFNANIGSGSNGRIRKIRKENSSIYLIGDFNYFNGNLSKHIVRINYSGQYDQSFNAGQGDNGKLNDAIEYDGKLYVTGNFSSYNNIPIHSLAKLNLDGTSVSGFYEPPYIGSSNIPGVNLELVGNALVLGAAKSSLDNTSSLEISNTNYYAYSYEIDGNNLSSQKLFYGDLTYLPTFSADSSDYYLKHFKIVKTDDEIFVLGISTLNIGVHSANFIGRYKIGSSAPVITTAIDPGLIVSVQNNLLLVLGNGQMMIHDNRNSKGTLKIVDLNGKEVYSQEDYQTNTQININAISTGMYIIKYVSTDQNNKVFKVIFN